MAENNLVSDDVPALEQILNESPPIVAPETPVADVIRLMNSSRSTRETDCVLVVEAGELVGIFTAGDAVRCAADGNLKNIPIKMAMTTGVIALNEREYRDIFQVFSLLNRHEIRHLPVVNGRGKLRGLISQSSLLKSFDPVALYNRVQNLQQKNSRLKLEKREILARQTPNLEAEIQIKIAVLEQQIESDRIFSQIAYNIRNSLNLGEILNTTVTEIQQLLGVDRVVIYRFNPDWSGVIVAESVVAGWRSILGEFIDDPCFERDWVEPYCKGRVRAVPDVYAAMSPCHVELLESLQVRAKIVVPLVLNISENSSSQPHLWGLLIVHNCGGPRQWWEHEIELLEKLALQIAIAIQQSELYHQLEVLVTKRTLKLTETNRQLCQEIQERSRVESALIKSNDILQAIGEAQSQFIADPDPSILFDILLENLLNLTASEYGFIGEILYTEGGEPYLDASRLKIKGKPHQKTRALANSLAREKSRDLSQESLERNREFNNFKSLWEAVRVTGKPVIANGTENRLKTEENPGENPALNAFLGIPFYGADQKLVGMVGVANCLKGYDQGLIEYLQPFLATCANIIEAHRNNCRRQEAEKGLRKSEVRSRLFTDITLKIRQSLQLDDILQTTVTEIQKILEVERVLIYQVFASGTGRVVFEEVQPGWTSILNVDFPEDVFPLEYQKTYYNGRAKAVCDVTEAYGKLTPCMVDFCRQWQIRAKLIVPILQENHLWGFMIAHQCSQPRNWRPFAIELLEQIAIQVGIALAQAERLKREKELGELKSRFISIASHEFRTPLTWIASSAGILEDYGDRLAPEKTQKHLCRIQSSVQYMTELLNDVLIISRAEAHRLECNPEPLELIDLCLDLVEEVQSLSGKHRVLFRGFDAQFPEKEIKTVSAYLDEKLLRQMLTNLLSNAIKYSPSAELVRFDLAVKDEEILFTIQDYGIGIPPEDQGRLFESFHRAKNVGSVSGTGLGLAIVKNCVQLLGGELSFNSQLGEGTTFEVKLPRIFPGKKAEYPSNFPPK
ncbi:GAF domain-containing protein [Capilliphycus salinus ALCB114379]|uniref:GAF domain-containing protein n=1 Tax=Capilliphycus salinus TaxID=2768948 RepID=UPI0039A6BDF4